MNAIFWRYLHPHACASCDRHFVCGTYSTEAKHSTSRGAALCSREPSPKPVRRPGRHNCTRTPPPDCETRRSGSGSTSDQPRVPVVPPSWPGERRIAPHRLIERPPRHGKAPHGSAQPQGHVALVESTLSNPLDPSMPAGSPSTPQPQVKFQNWWEACRPVSGWRWAANARRLGTAEMRSMLRVLRREWHANAVREMAAAVGDETSGEGWRGRRWRRARNGSEGNREAATSQGGADGRGALVRTGHSQHFVEGGLAGGRRRAALWGSEDPTPGSCPIRRLLCLNADRVCMPARAPSGACSSAARDSPRARRPRSVRERPLREALPVAALRAPESAMLAGA